MRPGLIGGALLLSSCLLFLVAAAIAATGGSVGLGSHEVGGLVLIAALACAGIGAGAMALRPPGDLDHRSVRIGFALLAVGLLSALASAIIGATMTSDPLESMPAVILFFVGGAASFAGSITTFLSLLVRPGRPRRLASLFVLGLVMTAIAGGVSNGLFPDNDSLALALVTRTLALIGGVTMLSAVVGIALLGIRTESSSGPNLGLS
ncbi:MAG: hypothetical protein ABI598_02245 [Chloroflexota bacterium]